MSMMCKTCLTARINLHNDETGAAGSQAQTSYLSQISQIISVEKNLSCGEISDFCKEFEQFMEFYRNLCRFCSKFVWRKICVEKISVVKKWQIWGLASHLEDVGEDDLPVLAWEQRRPGGELRRVGEVEDEDVERLEVERLVNWNIQLIDQLGLPWGGKVGELKYSIIQSIRTTLR